MSIPPSDSGFPSYGGTSSASEEDKLLGLLSYLLGTFFTFFAPLVIWLLKKDQSKFVAFHAIQAMLLHVFVAVGYAISGVLTLVLVGFITFPLFFLFGLIFSVLAGLAAFRGAQYDIPIIAPYARRLAGL